MLLILVAYLGGVFTILSPCILPVLPFVFARSDQPFARTGLPILIGMAVTFTAFASLAAIGGGWIVQANYYGRVGDISTYIDTRSVGLHEDIFLPRWNESRLVSNLPSD